MWYSNYHREENKHRQLYKCPICKKESYYRGVCTECYNLRKEDVLKHEASLEKRRKYTSGKTIQSVDEIFGYEFVYVNHKITHIGFLCSMPARVVYNMVKHGIVFMANKKLDGEEIKNEG